MSTRSAEDSTQVALILYHPTAPDGIMARCITAYSSLTEHIYVQHITSIKMVKEN